MCDEKSFSDMVEYALRTGGVSRREFGALTLSAGVTFALPPVANAADTTESEVEIKTPDGTADAYFVNPSAGKHPAVLVWPDGVGLLLGLAIFRLIALVMTGIPLLRELKKG